MNIVIVGGGELGSMVAEQLIRENHSITVIEKSKKQAQFLNDSLDALVINGDGNDVKRLLQANVEKADLFLALSNNDNVNIVSCGLVKKLSEATTIAKVENYLHYFPGPPNLPSDFGIDKTVATKQLSINKISDLISEPDAMEHIHFIHENVKIIGTVINEHFYGNGMKLKDITLENKIWDKIRIIAIKKDNEVLIPGGDDVLHTGDKLYIIGKADILKEVINLYFASKVKIKSVVIVGGNRIGSNFAKKAVKEGRRVTIIEEDEQVCARLTEELDNVLIIHGSGTNQKVLSDLDMENSFVVCVTGNDEHNIISAVLAKKNNAHKAVCNISNVAISPIVNQLKEIDSVFSTESLAFAEIIKYCRKGGILSVTPVPYIDAETIKIKISKDISILNTPLSKVKFPSGMIIGAIFRDNEVIIPHGNEEIKMNDIIIVFVLPESKKQTEKLFA
ncbi:MAG: Trk system potassium transporter TrkA [Candidatus Marinimicrobia bacterium]|nr:Trk system potassium transporter TrkA [Candidatus Neomarinimicrobiota bacterium]